MSNGLYRPDQQLMNAYADVLARATRAMAAAQRAKEYLELADLDGLEKQLVHTLQLQRKHIEKVMAEEGTGGLPTTPR